MFSLGINPNLSEKLHILLPCVILSKFVELQRLMIFFTDEHRVFYATSHSRDDVFLFFFNCPEKTTDFGR